MFLTGNKQATKQRNLFMRKFYPVLLDLPIPHKGADAHKREVSR